MQIKMSHMELLMVDEINFIFNDKILIVLYKIELLYTVNTFIKS